MILKHATTSALAARTLDQLTSVGAAEAMASLMRPSAAAALPLLRRLSRRCRQFTGHLSFAENKAASDGAGFRDTARGIHAGASATCERNWSVQRHAAARLDAFRSILNIHPSAHIHPSVQLAPTAVVRAHAFVGARAIVSDGAVVGTRVQVGAHTYVGAGVTLENCSVGNDCILHSGVCVGADGFGFYVDKNGVVVKKPQLLRVRIGNGVEVGAGSCIDRGSWRDTVIGDNTKLDNMVRNIVARTGKMRHFKKASHIS